MGASARNYGEYSVRGVPEDAELFGDVTVFWYWTERR